MKKILLTVFLLVLTAIVLAQPTIPGPAWKVNDEIFQICDDGDFTKCVMFELSGITTDNTRTLTFPDTDTTLLNSSEYTELHGWLDNVTLGSDGSLGLAGDLNMNNYNITVGAGDYTSTGSITTTDIADAGALIGDTVTIDQTQDYTMSGRGVGLTYQGQSSGTASVVEFFTKDGDGTDALQFSFYGLGTPSALTNRERLQYIYTVGSQFEIYSEAQGSGTLRPIVIWTEGNTNQLKLDSNGDVYMAALSTVASDGALHIAADGEIGKDASSIRFKENVRSLDGSERIFDLLPRRYDYKDGPKDRAGFIAEEVAVVMPEIVSCEKIKIYRTVQDPNGGSYEIFDHFEVTNVPQTVESYRLIPSVIEEMKILREELDIACERIEVLEAEVTELKNKWRTR